MEFSCANFRHLSFPSECCVYGVLCPVVQNWKLFINLGLDTNIDPLTTREVWSGYLIVRRVGYVFMTLVLVLVEVRRTCLHPGTRVAV